MKSQTIFVCSHCDSQFPKWSGRCASCGKWNTLVEQKAVSTGKLGQKGKPVKIANLTQVDAGALNRLQTNISEFDEILGGKDDKFGIVPGSLILLGGDPGIGKSTLALQAALNLANAGIKTLYVSGEESLGQIKLRAQRIADNLKNLAVVSENNLDAVLATAEQILPKFLVIDSIQTMYSETATGVAGGIAQVSAATARIMELAKSRNIATLIIGHVTKEGNLAGPRLLEHMVDTVLYLEGERFLSFRILRCIKNRFGSTNEVGVFEMRETGLVPVANPSEVFLSQRVFRKPGSIITCALEGSQVLLLEVQALTAKSQFNYPKRAANGFDFNRLQLIAAVLQKVLRLNLLSFDIFVSIAGGFKISETACDLAVALSIVSSFKDKAWPDDLTAVGELGLTGEVRHVPQVKKRIAEAAKLGFKKMLIPADQKVSSAKIKLLPVADIKEAVSFIR